MAFIISNIIVTMILALRGMHITYLQDVCINLPNIEGYEAPEGCYKFNSIKYLGIGWPVSAMFGTFFNFLYLVFVYTLWVVYDYMRKPKLAKKTI